MRKFNATISIVISDEYGGGNLYNENISAKSMPAGILFTLLHYIFKLTEAFQ